MCRVLFFLSPSVKRDRSFSRISTFELASVSLGTVQNFLFFQMAYITHIYQRVLYVLLCLVPSHMSDPKPSLERGFLGAQPKFSEMKLKTDSHKDAEFTVTGSNNVQIKIKTEFNIQVFTKFNQYKPDKELPEYVLRQRKLKENQVIFQIAFPDNGWYIFQIFALPENDTNESLPNVYNYLIEAEGVRDRVYPYAKTYTKFYQDGCYLEEPLFINPNGPKLDQCKFEVSVPGAHKVAVQCAQEWFQLEKTGGDKWEGKADLERFKNKNSKVSVMANYDPSGFSYSVLLEYFI